MSEAQMPKSELFESQIAYIHQQATAEICRLAEHTNASRIRLICPENEDLNLNYTELFYSDEAWQVVGEDMHDKESVKDIYQLQEISLKWVFAILKGLERKCFKVVTSK